MARFARLARHVTVTVKMADVREWERTEPGPMRELDRRATKSQQGARRRVGVRSGTLFSTIRKQPGYLKKGPYVDVVAGKAGLTPYMWVHHEGSPPHVIRATRAKALRFTAGGQVIFRSKVNHPGTKPNRFLLDSLDDAAD